MEILRELEYYCKESNPVGALLLTGEWGCGKTYLIEHDLKEKIKDTHILVRVSLFGVSSIDSLNLSVKRQWISECTSILGAIQDHDKAVKAGKTILGGVSSLVPVLKDVKDTVLSINIIDYITIKPVIDEKKVILVFDDLERCKLSTTDILGCINEYQENLRFNTIIIANEDFIRDNNTSETISYSEIKEKVVARTVCYKPNFTVIIRSLLQDREWKDEKYQKFLSCNESLILDAFDTIPTNDYVNADGKEDFSQSKPHNIRSLKCALHDFQRVYKKLEKYDVPDRESYLYSFIAYTIAIKSGIVEQNNIGSLSSEVKVKDKYPLFSSSTLPWNVRKWIIFGTWDDKLLNDELEKLVMQKKEYEPKDKLRLNRFFELDEEVIKSGFSELLSDCYAGFYNLNDYVLFINNSSWAREYNIVLPESIDWNKVEEGIRICFKRYIEENELENYTIHVIGEDSRKEFSEAELKAYDMIAEFRNEKVVVFENNKKEYLESIQKGIIAFNSCKTKKFKAFDLEMADATLKGFESSSQSDKYYFPGFFERLWKMNVDSYEIDFELTQKGFTKLQDDLCELKEQYVVSEKSIAAAHTKRFYIIVSKLLEVLKEKLKDSKGYE